MTAPNNPTTRRDDAFDEIVAAFDDQPSCEMRTQAGGRCRRSARWRVNLHGCEQAIMCTHHKEAWRGTLAGPGSPRCANCGRVFDCLDDAVRIVAI